MSLQDALDYLNKTGSGSSSGGTPSPTPTPAKNPQGGLNDALSYLEEVSKKREETQSLSTPIEKTIEITKPIETPKPSLWEKYRAWSTSFNQAGVNATGELMKDAWGAVKQVKNAWTTGIPAAVEFYKEGTLGTELKKIASEANKGLAAGEKDLGLNVLKAPFVMLTAVAEQFDEPAKTTPWNQQPSFLNERAKKIAQHGNEVINIIDQKRQEIQKTAGITADTPALDPKKFFSGLASGGGSLALAIGTTYVTKNPKYAAYALGFLEGTDMYNQAKTKLMEDGATEDEAEAKAFGLSLVNSVGIAKLEQLGIEALFRNYGGGLLRKMSINAMTETAQETSQTIFSNTIQKYGYDRAQGIFENVFDTIITTLPLGFIGGFATSFADIQLTKEGVNQDGTAKVPPVPPDLQLTGYKAKAAQKVANDENLPEEEAKELVDEGFEEIARQFAQAPQTIQRTNEARNVLKEDIRRQAQTSTPAEISASLVADEATPDITPDEANDLVEEALAEMEKGQEEIMNALNAVSEGLKPKQKGEELEEKKSKKDLKAPTDKEVKARDEEPVTVEERGTPEFEISDMVQEEANQDWEDNYAENYGELNTKYVALQKQLKTAKKSEVSGIKQKMAQINNETTAIEEGFVQKWRKQAVDKALQDTIDTVTNKQDNKQYDGETNRPDRNPRDDVGEGSDTSDRGDDTNKQAKRGGTSKGDSEQVARGGRDKRDTSVGERPRKDVKQGDLYGDWQITAEPFYAADADAEFVGVRNRITGKSQLVKLSELDEFTGGENVNKKTLEITKDLEGATLEEISNGSEWVVDEVNPSSVTLYPAEGQVYPIGRVVNHETLRANFKRKEKQLQKAGETQRPWGNLVITETDQSLLQTRIVGKTSDGKVSQSTFDHFLHAYKYGKPVLYRETSDVVRAIKKHEPKMFADLVEKLETILDTAEQNEKTEVTEQDVVKDLQEGKSVKATDLARAMGIEVVEVTGEPKTQKEQVKEVLAKKGEATIEQIAEETKILEPNIRRILGVGAKDGTFERVDRGVYRLSKDGQETAVIFPGDALEVLPVLVERGFKADMVFLDIPYKTAAVTGGNRGVKYDLITVDEFSDVLDSVKEIVRTEEAPVIHMYSQATSGLSDMMKYNELFVQKGFKPIGRGEYTKLQKDGITQVRNMRGDVIKPEGILVFNKSGKFDKELNLDFKLIRPKGYQTEKPADMLKALIKMTTEEGDVVLDPFAGSGVTIDEAVKAGRKAVGIEIKEGQAGEIAKRVAKSMENLTPKQQKFIQQFEKEGIEWARATPLSDGIHVDVETRAGNRVEFGTKYKTMEEAEAVEKQLEKLYGTTFSDNDAPMLDRYYGFFKDMFDLYEDKGMVAQNQADAMDKIIAKGDITEREAEYILNTISYMGGGFVENKEKFTEYFNGSAKKVEDMRRVYADRNVPLERYTTQQALDILTEVNDEGEVILKEGVEVNERLMDAVYAFEPAGGRETEGVEGRGLLDEYYTPEQAVDILYDLGRKYDLSGGYEGRVLEPAAGTGNLMPAIPGLYPKVDAFEINETAARVGKVLNKGARYFVKPFEERFIDKRGNKKEVKQEYGAVVMNPPYGEHRGLYKGLGEEPTIKKYEEYFLKRGMDVLLPDGILYAVIPSNWLRNTDTYTKREIAKKGELLEAFRLPNSSFEKTDIGTDIVVLRRDSEGQPLTQQEIDDRVRMMSDDKYFKDTPTHVLGETKERNGKFGLEEYVDGTLNDALKKYEEVSNAKQKMSYSNQQYLNAHSKENAKKAKKAPAEIKKEVEEKAEPVTKPAVKKRGKAPAKKKGSKASDETYVFPKEVYYESDKTDTSRLKMSKYSNATKEDLEMWKYVSATGELEGEFDPSKANYHNGKYYNDFNYYQGNIYEKLEQLEIDRLKMTEWQYEKQKKGLEAIVPQEHPLDRINITPNAKFVHETIMSNGQSLATNFKKWIQDIPYNAFKRTSRWDISHYVDGVAVRGSDKIRNEETRKARREEGNRFFALYLNENLNEQDKKILVEQYNKKFNGYVRPDYTRVPLMSEIHSTFKGNELNVKPVQVEGISFLVNKGVGLLAHDVGVGKTMEAIIANAELLQRGWAKRPLIVVPNTQLYDNWLKEIRAVIPNVKINLLGNLGGDFYGDVKDLKIEDGTLSIITAEGFSRLGFKEETYTSLTGDVTDALDKTKAGLGTKRQQAKDATKAEEMVGKAVRGTKDDVFFEDLGFDNITYDEIQNANHVFGSAKIGDGKATEFRGMTQQPSVEGTKLWLAAQHILKNNNGRGVIGLSATPFRNHVLEYYSILSMFARERMQQLGVFSVNDFMTMFMELSVRQEFKANQKYEEKTDVRSFTNYQQFQKLLTEFIDFKEDNTGRPERHTYEHKIPENSRQLEFRQAVQPLFADVKHGGVLKAIGDMRQSAISPYLSLFNKEFTPTQDQLIKGSPKLRMVAEMVARNLKDNPEGNQVIYSPIGVEVFGYLKDEIVKQTGLKPDQVQILSGKPANPKLTIPLNWPTSKGHRVNVIEKFNDTEGKYGDDRIKVVIGSEVIEEGVNLQRRSTDLFILSQPWNFTALRQVMGRIWRPGNQWKNVRIHHMLTENSSDIFMAQKLQTKMARYESSLAFKGDTLDVSDIDYEELKFDLLTDPVARVDAEFLEKDKKLGMEIMKLESDIAYKTRKVEKYVEARQRLFRQEKEQKEHPDWNWLANDIARSKQRLEEIRVEYTEKNIDLTSIDTEIDEAQAKLKAMEEERKNLGENKQVAIAEAKVARDAMAETATENADFTAELNTMSEETMRLFGDKDRFFQLAPGDNKWTLRSRLNGRYYGSVSLDDILVIPADKIQDFTEDMANAVADVKNGKVSPSSLPLLVIPQKDGTYHIKDGRHRYALSSVIGRDEVVYAMTDEAQYEKLAIAEEKVNKEANFQQEGYTFKGVGMETAVRQLQDYKDRLRLDFPVDFVDVILTPDGGKALGVEYEGGMTLTKWLLETSVDHEVVHKVIRHIEKIDLFKDIRRSDLLRAANGGRDYTVNDVERLSEKLAYGYEQFIANRPQKQVGIVQRFFEKLKSALTTTYNAIGNENLALINDFYTRLAEGKSEGEVVVELRAPIPAEQRVTRTGDIMVDFGFAEKRAAMDGIRQEFFQRLLEQETDEVNISRMRKDINILEKLTAQSRDLYLKDSEEFAAADAYGKVADLRRDNKRAIDNKFVEMLKPYYALKKAGLEKVNKVLMQGDRDGKEYKEATLRGLNLNAEEIEAYKGVRKAFNAAHAVLLDKMRQHGVPDEEIKAYEAERIGYMPHKWQGRYVVKTQRFDADNNKWTTERIDDFKFERQQKRAFEKMKQENRDPEVRLVLDTLDNLEVDFFTQQGLSFEAMKDVIIQSSAQKKTKAQMIDAIRNMFKEKGFGRQYIRRTGVEGYDTEGIPRIMADYFSGFAGYVTKMEAAKQYYAILSEVDARRQKNFYNWLRDAIAYDMGQSVEWEKLKATAFAYYLANDISFLAVNATQNFIVGAGELSKYLEGADKVTKPEAYIIKAMLDWTVKNVTDEERIAIEKLLEVGELGGQMASELTGFKNNPLYSTISSVFNKALFSTTQIVETNVNRVPAFLAARRIFKEQGMTDKEANEKALEVSDDIHFRYGKQHRPEFLRGRKNVLFVFYHYMRSFMYQLYRDASQKEYASFARKMMWTTAIGGVTSLPFAKLFMIIFSQIAGGYDDDELKEEMKGWELLYKKGIPAYAGVDLSNRVGIELMTLNQIAESQNDIRSYLGVIGALLWINFKNPDEGGRLQRAITLLGQGREADAFGYLLPDMLANPLKAYQGYNVGVRSFAGTPLETADGRIFKYNTWEAIIKATGLTPTRESLRWDAKSKEWDMQDRKQAARSDIRREIQYLVQTGDYEEARTIQNKALAEGVIDKDTDYVREFGKARFIEEGLTEWKAIETPSTTDLKRIEENIIKQAYPEGATDLQRNNVRKEFAVYRTFGMENNLVNDLMSAESNEEKVQLLLKARFDMGEEAFKEFFNRARKQITLESGRKSEILISDDLKELYRKAQNP